MLCPKKRFLDLFFACWDVQINAGRFCSGENPWTSEAWKDPRFAKLQARYTRNHQCMVGLLHPDGSGRTHKKDTRFICSSPSVSILDIMCDGKHEHAPIEETCKGQALSKIAEEYPTVLANRILKMFLADQTKLKQCSIYYTGAIKAITDVVLTADASTVEMEDEGLNATPDIQH